MILLLESETERISEEKALSIDQFTSPIDGSQPYTRVMKKTQEGRCLFLKDKLCSIYEYRPLICRFYPFQLIDLDGDHYQFKETNECPGINKGPSLGKPFFKKMFEEATTLMKSKEIKKVGTG